MLPRKIDDSIVQEMENRLSELQPSRQEQLAQSVKVELEKDFSDHVSVSKVPYSPGRYAFVYGLGGFLLGAAAMFACLLCMGDRFTKIVVHEVVREIPVTSTTETVETKNTDSRFAETPADTTKTHSSESFWNVSRFLGFDPKKRYDTSNLDELLERQRELANRPRSSPPRFVMQSFRPTNRENYDSHRTYRDFLETQTQHF